MRSKIAVVIVSSLLLCFTLTSCGGGGAKVESTVSTQTLGQQLIDLNKAFKEGVITEEEYKKNKEVIEKHYK